MKTITSKITINSSSVDIWNVLIDFPLYPNWNPFIISMRGDIALNNKLEVKVKPVGGAEMTFRPTILSYTQNEEITWEGNLFVKGLFDGKHSFKLIQNNNGTVTFIQSEIFKGILVPFFRNLIENKTLKGFHLMNQKLKEIVENKNFLSY